MPVMYKPETLERWSRLIYGCSYERAVELNDGLPLRRVGTKAHAFRGQQLAQRSKYRVPFALTFAEWWEAWDRSGHFARRAGRTETGYIMTRKDRAGDFSADNVEIVWQGTHAAEWGREGRALQCAAATS